MSVSCWNCKPHSCDDDRQEYQANQGTCSRSWCVIGFEVEDPADGVANEITDTFSEKETQCGENTTYVRDPVTKDRVHARTVVI